jgi:hypothetical protein
MVHLTQRQRETLVKLLTDKTDPRRLGAVVLDTEDDGNTLLVRFSHETVAVDDMGRVI